MKFEDYLNNELNTLIPTLGDMFPVREVVIKLRRQIDYPIRRLDVLNALMARENLTPYSINNRAGFKVV